MLPLRRAAMAETRYPLAADSTPSTPEICPANQMRDSAQAQVLGKEAWGIDERVAVDLPHPENSAFARARKHPEDAALLGPSEPGLEADQVVGRAGDVLVPELDTAATGGRSGIAPPHRLHRAVGRGVSPRSAARPRWEAPFEVSAAPRRRAGPPSPPPELADERAVLDLVEREVQVVIALAIPSGWRGRRWLVHRLGSDDGAMES